MFKVFSLYLLNADQKNGSKVEQAKFLIVKTVCKKDLNDKLLAEIRQHPVALSSVLLTISSLFAEAYREQIVLLLLAISGKCEYSTAQQVYKYQWYFRQLFSLPSISLTVQEGLMFLIEM